ncbi:MAG TPA: hypothetical protein VFQ45_04105 [Longimicrobium sp.]|nr:hypothetical protein [Longimicrobium sp.]
MRKRMLGGLPAVLVLMGALACGGSEEGDPKDIPGVDASGTADTELFTKDPTGQDVPTAEQGGTAVDSVRPGTPGTPYADSTDVGKS